MPLKQIMYCSIALLLSALINSAHSQTDASTDDRIHQLYHELKSNPTPRMPERLARISTYFLNTPYALFPLGEGRSGEFDKAPRYRTDVFDCETFVDTVLAIALATNTQQFKQCMDALRYQRGQVSFITRNHFTSIDWNKYNQASGLLYDMTTQIHDENQQSLAVYSHTLINKSAWYQRLSATRIRLPNVTQHTIASKLKQLRQKGRQFKPTQSVLAYIPFTALFNPNGEANLFVFKQIPDASIIEIIRPNWDLTAAIGTHYDVSHLGFAFWKNGVLMFRHASLLNQDVSETPLIDYLRAQQHEPTIQGIHVQTVIPNTAYRHGCRHLN